MPASSPDITSQLNPSGVYLVSEPERGGPFGVASVVAPDTILLELPSGFDRSSLHVSPSASLMFIAKNTLQEAHCSRCGTDDGDAGVVATAIALMTPPCDPRDNRLRMVLMGPAGDVVHMCDTMRWYDEKGIELYAGPRAPWIYRWHLGHDRIVFVGAALLDFANGTETELHGLPDAARSQTVVRATAGGFRVVTWDSFSDPPELWEVDSTGHVERKGRYPALENFERLDFETDAVLDESGALYTLVRPASNYAADTLLRRTIRGETQVLVEPGGPYGTLAITMLVSGP